MTRPYLDIAFINKYEMAAGEVTYSCGAGAVAVIDATVRERRSRTVIYQYPVKNG